MTAIRKLKKGLGSVVLAGDMVSWTSNYPCKELILSYKEMLIEIIIFKELLTEATIPPIVSHVLICCLNFFLIILRVINY